MPSFVSTRAAGWLPFALAGVLLGADAATAATSTGPADVSLVVMRVTASANRARRIRNHLSRPRPLPRALVRRLPATLVAVSAAGEVAANTFGVAVAVINRGSVDRVETSLEVRLARTAFAIRASAVAVADDLLSAAPSPTFCAGLAPELASSLTSPALQLARTGFVPWTPSAVLRNAIGLAFVACARPLPPALLGEDVARLAEAIRTPSTGTTTTTLEEDCHGVASLGPMPIEDPPYPDCTDVEWITPIPGCADDLAVDVRDDATGRPIDSLLFGHTTHVTYFFGLRPIRLVLRACNREPGSPGGGRAALSPIVSWGG